MNAMMINKRLIGAVPESKKYIAGNVIVQWMSLIANVFKPGLKTAMYWIYFGIVMLLVGLVAAIASTFIFYQRRD